MSTMFVFCCLLALLYMSAHGQSCTTNDDCLDGCTDKPLADFVFLIDCSSSMQKNIDAVRLGIPQFVQQIQEKKTLARFAVVLFAMEPEVILDWTNDGDRARTILKQVVAGAGNYFSREPRDLVHFDHDCKHTADCSTREPAFEALRMVLGKAKNNTFSRHPESKTALFAGEGITWRPSADRYVFLVTDEDSDCPFHDVNRFSSSSFGPQCSGPGHIVSDNDMTYQPTRRIRNNMEWPDLPHPWQQEIQATADAIVETRAHVSVFTRPENGLSLAQFGDPSYLTQSQNADFSNFNADTTLANLRSNGYRHSLQTLVLAQQLMQMGVPADMRVFDTNDITNPNVVNNFFREVVATIKSSCFGRKRHNENMFSVYEDGLMSLTEEQRKRQSKNCQLNFCETDIRKCRATPRCDDMAMGCDNCQIDGQCVFDGDTNPRNRCQACNFFTKADAWIDACDDKDDCTEDECILGADGIQECKHTDACIPQCNKCSIDGQCYEKGTVHPTNECWACHPRSGTPTDDSCKASGLQGIDDRCYAYNSWTDILPYPKPECGTIDPCSTADGIGKLGCACSDMKECFSPLANGTAVTCNRDDICEIVPATMAPTPRPPVVICEDPVANIGESGCPCFGNNTCGVPALLICAHPVRNECVLCQFNCHEHGKFGKRCRQELHPLRDHFGECDEGLMCQGVVCVKAVETPAPAPCASGAEGCGCNMDGSCANEDLICEGGRCENSSCKRGSNGCPCSEEGECNENLLCDKTTKKCRYCEQGEERCRCLDGEVCKGDSKTLVCASGVCTDTCSLKGDNKCCMPGTTGCVCLKGECSEEDALCSIYDICDLQADDMDPCVRSCQALAKQCEFGATSCSCDKGGKPEIFCRDQPFTMDDLQNVDSSNSLLLVSNVVFMALWFSL